MFHSARLKLTLWYLLITVLISFLFSFAIYSNVSRQIESFIAMQNNRVRSFQSRIFLDLDGLRPHSPPLVSVEELREQELQLLYTLIFVNVCILVLTGGAGYFLAGRTLRPIKEMVDEQNNFIGSASHELRTPIATLRAEMEGKLLEKRITDDDARKLIASNLEELTILQNLSNKLLQLAETPTIVHQKNLESVSLKEVIESARTKISKLAAKKNIVIKVAVSNISIRGDASSLTELFVILFDNAIKYSPQNSTVTISSEETSGAVKIKVSDGGFGIPKEDLPHIFERFYRADKSRSQVEGFGLGLAIAKEIVKTHDGIISVKSEVEKGATFTLQFPSV